MFAIRSDDLQILIPCDYIDYAINKCKSLNRKYKTKLHFHVIQITRLKDIIIYPKNYKLKDKYNG